MNNTVKDEQEVCPNCGKFVDALTDSGWCGACTKSPAPSNRIKHKKHKESRIERWLTNNADTIESLMTLYKIPPTEAIRIVALEDAPASTCALCGSEVSRTRHQNFFCSKNLSCRKARRYYKYLIYDKGFNKPDAFTLAIRRFKNDK